jgi:DNA (cytosine-5)-methyltransferase 1
MLSSQFEVHQRAESFMYVGGVLGLAFPDYEHRIPQEPQLGLIVLVARPIALEFRHPIVARRPRCGRAPAPFMAMPETAVHKDDPSPSTIRKIRGAGQSSDVLAVGEPERLKRLGHPLFRHGILRSYPRHDLRAGERGGRLSPRRPAATIDGHSTLPQSAGLAREDWQRETYQADHRASCNFSRGSTWIVVVEGLFHHTSSVHDNNKIFDRVPRMKAGALFAGIGGFCLGFHKVGIPTSWAIDNDFFANETYKSNLPGVRVIPDDVQSISVQTHDLEPVDVLHAGFPCQSFSQAGGRRGFTDPRGKLFYEIIRIVGEFRDRKPKAIVLENSPYLRYGEGGIWFLELQKQIQRAGYWFREVNCAELNAYDITDLPQQRVRLYMVAFLRDYFKSGRFSFPIEKNPAPKRLDRYVDFEGEQSDEYYLDPENRYFKMISGRVRNRRSLYQLRKYEVRAKEPDVCPTLTANMGLGGHNVPFVVDRRGLRKLTEDECLRLQGFPSGFSFPGVVPRAKRYVQVGNAVTVPVAELVAKQVRLRILEERGDD